MKFKKGDMNNFVSVVLALIAIVGLVFLSVKLANFFVDQDMKNAKNFINSLNGKIENLNDGESNTFALRGIEGWVLVGWNKEVRIADDGETINSTLKPQKCFDKNCLCLCRESSSRCQEEGYCKEVDRDITVFSSGSVDYFSSYATGGAGGHYFAEGNFSTNCIYFTQNNLVPISINKMNDKINIGFIYDKIFTSSYDGLKNDLIKKGCTFVFEGKSGP